MKVNGVSWVTNTYKPVPVPAGGLAISTHASEGAQEKAMARTVTRPLETYKCWIIQADRATAHQKAAQILEMVRNTDIQPCYVDFEDTDTLLDGWYHLTSAQNFDYRNDFSGIIPFDLVLRREEARGRNRGISWRPALMSVAQSGTTALGLPNDVVSLTPNISRTGAEGAVTVATGLSDLGGLIQVTGATPDFTKRVRVYDRGTGSAAPNSWSGSTPSGWVEVFSPDHVFVSDVILTNGLIMVVFAAGSLPQVYRYQNSVWATNEQLTWQPTGGGTNQTVQSAMVSQLGWERGTVVAQLAANGKQSRLSFAIERGMVHVDVVGKSTTGGGQLVYVSPKVIKLALNDIGLADVSKSDAAWITAVNAYTALMSTDASMTWLPVIGQTSQAGLGSVGTANVLLPAVAQGASQRAAFGAWYQSGGTAFLQQEAESLTLVGAGATSAVDAAASNGHAVQCVGTETTEGISFVPGTDGIGVPTGMTYGVTARVRVGNTDAQVCKIVPNSGNPTYTLVTHAGYGGDTPASSAAVTAATGQSVSVLRARFTNVANGYLTPDRFYRLDDTNATLVDTMAHQNGAYGGGYTQSQAGALVPSGDADNATLFNGTNGWAQFDGSAYNGNTTLSIFGFVKIAANPAGTAVICAIGQNSGTRSMLALVMDTSGRVYGSTAADDNAVSSALSTATWHSWAVTVDSTINQLTTYVDGAQTAQKTLGGTMNITGAVNSRIACVYSGSVNSALAPASIDEVLVYTSVLSANQVRALHNSGRAVGNLYIDEVGIIPMANAGNGPLDLFQNWSAGKKIYYPSFPTT